MRNKTNVQRRRKSMVLLLAAMALLSTGVIPALPAQAQKAYSTPAIGTRERKAIMDALRAPVQKKLDRPVIFEVSTLRVKNGWAFLNGIPRRPDGGPVNYKGTPYEEAKKEGMFDDGICALLRQQGGKWRVVTYVLGPTDVPWEDWDKRYKAPAAIFPRYNQ